MPCRDYDSDYDRLIRMKQSIDREYKDRLDRLTKLLCELCTSLEANRDYWYINNNEDLLKWWIHHKKMDKKYNK